MTRRFIQELVHDEKRLHEFIDAMVEYDEGNEEDHMITAALDRYRRQIASSAARSREAVIEGPPLHTHTEEA